MSISKNGGDQNESFWQFRKIEKKIIDYYNNYILYCFLECVETEKIEQNRDYNDLKVGSFVRFVFTGAAVPKTVTSITAITFGITQMKCYFKLDEKEISSSVIDVSNHVLLGMFFVLRVD